MFGGHRQYGIGHVMALVCHMISQGRVIKRSREFVCRRPSMVFVYHMIFQ